MVLSDDKREIGKVRTAGIPPHLRAAPEYLYQTVRGEFGNVNPVLADFSDFVLREARKLDFYDYLRMFKYMPLM